MTVSPLPARPSPGEALAGLGAALDELARVAWGHASPDELAAGLRALESAGARLDSARLSAAAAVDSTGVWAADGAATPQAWLRARAHLAPGRARALMHTVRDLPEMPLLAAALAEGTTSLEHVRIAAQARRATAARRAAWPEAEPILAEAAAALDPRQFALVVDRWAAAVDPLGAAAGDLDAFARRCLRVSPVGDGVAVDGFLDPEAGALLLAALAAVGDQAHRAQRGHEPGAPAVERPTAAQRRADALADIARAHLARGKDPDTQGTPLTGGVRPHALLITSSDALARQVSAGPARGAGPRPGARHPGRAPDAVSPAPAPPWPWARPPELDGIGPVSADTARRLTCDAAVHPLLVDPQWQPLAFGRTQRTVPPALRRAIALRDGGCRFAGCDRPAALVRRPPPRPLGPRRGHRPRQPRPHLPLPPPPPARGRLHPAHAHQPVASPPAGPTAPPSPTHPEPTTTTPTTRRPSRRGRP